MGKIKIELVTLTDVQDFVKAMEAVGDEVYLVDGDHKFKVSGKSVIGAMLASAEWKSTYIESEADLYEKVKKWAK